MSKSSIDTRIVIRNARLSFVRVAEPDDNGKYSTAILIAKDNPAVAKIKEITEALIFEGKQDGSMFKGVPDKKILTPLHDGDEDRPDAAGYKGMYYLNARTKTKPQVLDKFKQRITDGELLNEKVYSGVYAHVSVSLYNYNNNSIGVGVSLGNIMSLEYGEKLGGGKSADQDFADIEAADDDELGL